METARPTHSFEPLSHPDEIRLLHLAAGNPDDPLSGKLEHVRLASSPYEALSYEWGHPERKHAITLQDGSVVHITQSLHDALRDIRQDYASGRPRTIWADAICINQNDLKERQQQVAMMGTIYRSAMRVITYIGPDKDDSFLAIEFAQNLRRYAMSRDEDPDPRLHLVEELVNVGLPPISDPLWKAVKALLQRGWVSQFPGRAKPVKTHRHANIRSRRPADAGVLRSFFKTKASP
jgi:Heterokaryon incompatibility protein (HET)